jgi:hypothetical protein
VICISVLFRFFKVGTGTPPNSFIFCYVNPMRIVWLLFLGAIGFLFSFPSLGRDSAQALTHELESGRVVLLAGGLPDESIICLSTLVAKNRDTVLLLDSPKVSSQLKDLLQSYQSDRVLPVGSFPEDAAGLEQRLGCKIAPIIQGTKGPASALWKEYCPLAECVVVCPAEPRRQLLQAGCLAGASGVPLFVLSGQPEEKSLLRKQLADWKTRKIYAVGDAAELCHDLKNVPVVRLADTEAVAQAHRRLLRQSGPIQTLVLANPADIRPGQTSMSALAPWIAIQHRAALLLTNDKGDDAGNVTRRALITRDLRETESLILVGDLSALPMERRPNPIAGKDQYIEMEPMTPAGMEPFTLATGRFFGDDPALVPWILARQKLLESNSKSLKALVVSNPSGGLPLLEAFSRNTTKELANTGYQTSALFNQDVNANRIRSLLPDQDIFLWEGHYATLTKEYKMHEWTEATKPSLVFLQSCLALAEGKAQPFLQRGAVALIGTSTRTYSASGGACALAFFDALLYDRETVGGSLRQAKNFLLAYSLLKEKRLGKSAKLTGANLRSSWAFSLWGDPTLRMPMAESPDNSLPPVGHEVRGHTISISLPETRYRKAISNQYQAEMSPNGRLAGLITPDEDEENVKHLVPFIFAEVHLPKVPTGKIPRLHSRLPESRWVFNWDARRKCGYLLLMPRIKDQDEIRFHVDWEDETIARKDGQ